MAKTKTPKKTIWQLDSERPPNCLNFGTRRECGKPAAIQSGCKVGPCAENLEATQKQAAVKQARAENKAALENEQTPKKATPRRLKSYDSEAYLLQAARENAVRPKGTREGNWVWHTTECCSMVWRPVSFGCVRVAPQTVG